ncbi:hypothetical protein Goklo_014352 [Gossypium klotzschianum]|uniref:Uncharacterized protein n=1 Tax=Gossypium klotzschianum TaxID=34286 RepID=A0A7J8U7K8_9ROSI|nr:hypothetical protein [Gossypium klotzschianum]
MLMKQSLIYLTGLIRGLH